MSWDLVVDVLLAIIPLVVAITFHEAAHGFVAHRLGDDTAYRMGRVTFNPFRHIDRFGTIILPGLFMLMSAPVMFGYAKPVPVNFHQLNNPRRDTILVALAGPGVNVLLALLSGLLLHLDMLISPEALPWLFRMLYISIMINLVLAVLNMLPILPLDGGRVLGELLPASMRRLYHRSERYGMLVVMLVFLVPAFIPPLSWISTGILDVLIRQPALFLVEWALKLTGNGI